MNNVDAVCEACLKEGIETPIQWASGTPRWCDKHLRLVLEAAQPVQRKDRMENRNSTRLGPPVQRVGILIVPWLLTLTLESMLLGGCDVLPNPGGGTTNSAATPSPVAHTPLLSVMYCPDIGAYDHTLFAASNHYMAGSLDAAVHANSDGIRAYITEMGAPDLFAPSATPIEINTGAIPNWPPAPKLQPTPTPDPNDPTTNGAVRGKVSQANDKTLADYQGQVQTVQHQLDQARAGMAAQTAKLRTLDPPRVSGTPSPWPCLDLAAHRFGGWPGDKWVVIASSLPFTWQGYVGTRLDGIHIRVIFLACSSTPSCRSLEAKWAGAWRQTGAQDWLFYDQGESSMIPPLFGASQ